MTAERKRIEFNTVDELAHACVDFNRRCRANFSCRGEARFPVMDCFLDDDPSWVNAGGATIARMLEHG